MDWTEYSRVRMLRAKSRPADVAVQTIEGFRKHRSGRNAALISHFGFISVFPLLLVFTTVLGFVLQNNAKLLTDIKDSALAQLPFVGGQIATDPSKLEGNALVLILGVVISLWGGMKAFIAVHGALDDIAEIPLDDRANLFITRLHALLGILYVGGAQIGAAILASIATITNIAVVGTVLLLAGAVAINAGVLALSYRWLRTTRPTWHSIAPGAIVGGVLFAALQAFGVAIVGRAIAKASPVYGKDFASVIGLLTWLSLHAMISLGGAELNAALIADGPPRPPDCDDQ
ncbi:MAG: YhjD/YihY/BrkB family envelope integrity protein [Ilumatobacteraceae bacterium]